MFAQLNHIPGYLARRFAEYPPLRRERRLPTAEPAEQFLSFSAWGSNRDKVLNIRYVKYDFGEI